MTACQELVPDVGIAAACRSLEVSRATFYRRLREKDRACENAERHSEQNTGLHTITSLKGRRKRRPLPNVNIRTTEPPNHRT